MNKTSKIFETKLANHDIIGSMLKNHYIENIFAYLDSNGEEMVLEENNKLMF